MRRTLHALLGLSVALSATAGAAVQAAAPSNPTRAAFDHTLPPADEAQRVQFTIGRILFNHVWTPGGPDPEAGTGVGRAQAGGRALVQNGFAGEGGFHGLGPTYNRLSCAACHIKNGRGEPPQGPDDALRAMLVRLSVPGEDAHGGPKPHPAYGDQINDQSVPGVPAEARVFFTWHERVERLADGTEVPLRAPEIRITDPAFGPLGDDAMTSPRMGPPVFGLGLLEAVPERVVLALAEAQAREGVVSGQPNRVWDREAGVEALGRFGLKANQPTVRQQIAGAFVGDLGITTRLYPQPNCPEAQDACTAYAAKDEGLQPELSEAMLDTIHLYTLALQPPPRRGVDDPAVRRGEAVFAETGCARCHAPSLETAEHPLLPGLGGGTIHPYSDLLLHDLGDGLADGRPDHRANGRQWRTAPLWGLGLVPLIADHPAYLHDGRARSPLEAVLWHGGEAQGSVDAVRALPTADREALLSFLASL
ncbi:thiol oxidoreductase (plasmid) [Azospirillum argentinense]|uniref:Thiol oxidoreductase n=1 Tax=Azospirillum argentinense TaxID=2970906 RepID=A0A060DXA5_9PROT|nr:di-heme oxidoredictase family protein [Azospirillum argentinense]AIB15733.1 thiol oxidoreductase [Azospirillum argentinense]EZQ03240.1 thiol oxidoreductase [Azospirillum argentinense]